MFITCLIKDYIIFWQLESYNTDNTSMISAECIIR